MRYSKTRTSPVVIRRLQNNTTLGILFMLMGMGLLATMDAVAKWLIEHSVHTMQILAIRSVLIAPTIILVFYLRGKARDLVPTRPIAQGLRGLVGTLGPLAFFLALAKLPLADAVVVFFSSIFMTTVLSVFFLGEKVGTHRWIAVAAGYIGVFIAMSPSFGGDMTGYLLVLLSSLTYTMLFVSGRKLSATESVSSLVLSYNIGVGVISLFLLYWFWNPISLENWLWLVVLSFVAACGHFCVTYAFSVAEASIITPFEYTAVIWAVSFDALIWQISPAGSTVLGAVVIIFSGLYVIHREKVKSANTH